MGWPSALRKTTSPSRQWTAHGCRGQISNGERRMLTVVISHLLEPLTHQRSGHICDIANKGKGLRSWREGKAFARTVGHEVVRNRAGQNKDEREDEQNPGRLARGSLWYR